MPAPVNASADDKDTDPMEELKADDGTSVLQ